MRIVTLILLGAAIAVRLNAATIHVPSQQPTIQAGINAAAVGDTILVAPGRYVENIDFTGKTVIVHASGGPEFTSLEPASPNTPTVTATQGEGNGTELSGFTIQNGGLVSTVMINCVYIAIKNNVFRNNIPVIENPLTVIRAQTPCEISRNVFYDNKGINCIYSSSTARIINNTFDGNARAIYSHPGSSIAVNNLITNTAGYALLGNFITKDYNLVWPGGDTSITGPHGLWVYPEYIDSAQNDYRLLISSPCINAGHPGVEYIDPDGTRNDIGAYPFTQPTGLPVAAAVRLDGQHHTHVVDHTPNIRWTFYDTVGTQAAYSIELDDDGDWSDNNLWGTGEIFSYSESVFYDGPELLDGAVYFIRVRVFNAVQWGDWTATSFRMNSLPAAPTPLFPADSGFASSVSFSPGCLSDGDDAENDLLQYYCIIWSDPGMTNPIDTLGPSEPDSGFTQFPRADTLVIDEYYYWSTVAYDGFEFSPPSAPVVLYTPPTPVTLTVPAMYADIQGAIENAGASDTILVSPGTYLVQLDFHAKDVTVKSTAGRDSTFLEPTGIARSIVTMGHAQIRAGTLDGFTIRNTYSATAVRCQSGTVRNCDISYNHTLKNTGGIAATSRYALVENCRLHHNYAKYLGGAMGLDGDALVRDCEFFENVAAYGAAITVDHGRIERNLIRNHSGTDSLHGAIWFEGYAGSRPQIRNNTIVDNFVGIAGRSLSDCVITGNIFAFNELWDAYATYNQAFGLFNCIWNSGPHGSGLHNYYGLFIDPLFTDTAADNYSLLPWSPCIDASGPDSTSTEPDGTRIDMGAISYIHQLPTAARINFGADNAWALVNKNPTFHWSFFDTTTGAWQSDFELEIDTVPSNEPFTLLRTGPVISSDTFFACTPAYLTLSAGVSYCYRIRVNNGTAWGGWHYGWIRTNEPPPLPAMLSPIDDWSVNVNGARFLVDTTNQSALDTLSYDIQVFDNPSAPSPVVNVTGWGWAWYPMAAGTLEPDRQYWWRVRSWDQYEYSDWTALEPFRTRDTCIELRVPGQFPTVQAAMNRASEHDTVLIGPGTYTGDGNRDLRYHWVSVDLVSSHGPAQTIFDLQGTTDEPHNAILGQNYRDGGLVQGITFRNGYRVGGGVIYGYQTDRFSIRNCVFENNGAAEGGVIHGGVRGGEITDCVFKDNWAGYAGGAIAWIESPTIVNCQFLDNHSVHGGALYRADIADIRDCLFRGNSGEWGSAISGGGGEVYRSVFSGNQGGPLIYIANGSIEITQSTMVGNSTTVVVLSEASGSIRNSIVAFNDGSAMGCSDPLPEYFQSTPWIENSCIYGNDYGFIGCIGQFADTLGNFSLDPLFCDTNRNDFRLQDASPCAHAAPDGSHIGAVAAGCIPTDVEESGDPLPHAFALFQNYPNPFNPATQISYDLPTASHVVLEVMNILGQRVVRLIDQKQSAGRHVVIWKGVDSDGHPVASGLYFYRIVAGDYADRKKMLLIK